MTDQLWTVNSIRDAARAKGSHWFDPGTMRFFKTRVLAEVYQGPGGIFFITTDADGPRDDAGRGATVRQFTAETADIKTVGEVAGYKTTAAAKRQAKRLAAGKGLIGFSKLVDAEDGGLPWEVRGVKTASQPFRPVTVAEQFLHDLHTHGCPAATPADVRRLMAQASYHESLAEQLCNGTLHTSRNGTAPAVTTCRARIIALAARLGCRGVLFSLDPRACTAKLVFADGFTNDFAREGYCVPTEEDQADDEPADL